MLAAFLPPAVITTSVKPPSGSIRRERYALAAYRAGAKSSPASLAAFLQRNEGGSFTIAPNQTLLSRPSA